MSNPNFSALYSQIFEANGLSKFDVPLVLDLFERFTSLYMDYNAKTNLSAIRDLSGVIAKHFADCLLGESLFPQGAKVLDVGCGGGFPTFPLAIARPDLQIVAVDSTGKKIAFVKETASALGLRNIEAHAGRIEEAWALPFRASFDVVTSRAVAAMPILTEITLPFVKIGGHLIAMKGAQGSEELTLAASAIQKLGGALVSDLPMTLQVPSDDGFASESRHILVIRKELPSPSTYPRPYAAIMKKPL